MKIQTKTIINRPLSQVVELFGNQDDELLWQSNLIHMTPGNLNSNISYYYYEVNGRSVEVRIEIIQKNLPEVFELFCEMDGLTLLVKHKFVLSDEGTIWVLDSEFKAKSVILKLAMLFTPRVFSRQTEIYMQNFKNFIEGMEPL